VEVSYTLLLRMVMLMVMVMVMVNVMAMVIWGDDNNDKGEQDNLQAAYARNKSKSR
jgi:hypothetical protein